MSIIWTIKAFFSRLFGRKDAIPVHANCAICGERVYLPYHCHYCNQFYCGEHRLPFNHDCKNIDAWKNRCSSAGPATEYRHKKVRVRK